MSKRSARIDKGVFVLQRCPSCFCSNSSTYGGEAISLSTILCVFDDEHTYQASTVVLHLNFCVIVFGKKNMGNAYTKKKYITHILGQYRKAHDAVYRGGGARRWLAGDGRR